MRMARPTGGQTTDGRTWAKSPAAAICDRGLSHGPLRTLSVIALHADRSGRCRLRNELIARIRGVSREQIQADIFALKSRGYLIVSPTMRKRGGNGANEYQVIYPSFAFEADGWEDADEWSEPSSD